jgi:hypothetical protein
MRSKVLILAALLTGGTGGTRVSTLHAGSLGPSRLNLAFATVSSVSAAPGTIGFQAANPGQGVVSGSSPGSLTWLVSSGSVLKNWTLSVQAGASSFSSCPTVPASAIQVNCGSATAGGGGTGSCSGSFPLSTTPQQIAGGLQGNGTNSYSVSINFTLAESWRYVANSSCILSITYSISAVD